MGDETPKQDHPVPVELVPFLNEKINDVRDTMREGFRDIAGRLERYEHRPNICAKRFVEKKTFRLAMGVIAAVFVFVLTLFTMHQGVQATAEMAPKAILQAK